MPINNSYDEKAVIEAICTSIRNFLCKFDCKNRRIKYSKNNEKEKSVFISSKSYAECSRNC